MTTPREIAEAFSGHRFRETYDHLAPDMRWRLVGAETVTGREQVKDLCEQTLSGLETTTTEFSRFLTIADADAVAVDVVASYTSADGSVTVVSSCDLYEFTQGVVTTITSYTAEVEATADQG